MKKIAAYLISRRKLILWLLGLFICAWWLAEMQTATFRKEAVVIETGSGRWEIRAEIAETPAQQRQGLMHRKTLEENAGMLFIAPAEREMAMWMKNTPLPLDMLFLDNRGVIVYIAHDAKPFSEERIAAGRRVRGVLEIPGGSTKRHNIRRGDRVIHPAFAGRAE